MLGYSGRQPKTAFSFFSLSKKYIPARAGRGVNAGVGNL
nr:MAG TPA: hypothetical protein [Caudoviricetes sp.]